MTPDEAKTIVDFLKDADGGCNVCVCSLVKDFKRAFPGILTDDEILEILDNSDIEKYEIEV